MRKFDQAAIIWTIIIVVTAIGFTELNDYQNHVVHDEITQIQFESASQEISRGGIAQQATIKPIPSLIPTPNQGISMQKDSISLSKITRTISPNAVSVTRYFDPQGSMQNTLTTLQQFGQVKEVLYDKQSTCYAIIKTLQTSSLPEALNLTPKKLYKCDGTFIREVPSMAKFFTFDTKGNLFYFVDMYDSTDKIDKVTPDGTTSIFLNHYARGIAIDSQDNMYITDIGYQIHKYDKNGNLITTWKGGNTAGWAKLYAATNSFFTLPYYAELKHTFSTQEGSFTEEKVTSHWYYHVNNFPGYANSPELTWSPQADCVPSAKLRYDYTVDTQTLRFTLRDDGNFIDNQNGALVVFDDNLLQFKNSVTGELIPTIMNDNGVYVIDNNPLITIQENHTTFPYITTRGDYNQNGELRAGSATNHGVFLNTDLHPCVVVIFIHGYNNKENEAIDKYNHLRGRLLDLGTPELADNLILYTWDSDMGAASSRSFHQAKSVAVSNGNALAAFTSEYRTSHPTTKIFVISHSLGAELLVSAINKGAVFDRVDMLAPAIEASYLDSTLNVGGGLYVHVNTEDGVLQTAKNLELVNNPLGLEGGPKTCNPEGITTWNFGSIAIDSHDDIYVATPGAHTIFKIDSTGNYITGFSNTGPNGHEFSACDLIVGDTYEQSGNSLTSNGNKILIGPSTAPKFGFYYDYFPPMIPELKIYEVLRIPNDPNADNFKPNAFDATLNESDASTILSPKSCQPIGPQSGFILAKCTYEDDSGNKLDYTFPKKIVELKTSFDIKTSTSKSSIMVKKSP